MVRPFNQIQPTVPASAYVDPSAQVIGDVVLGEHASVWMNAVIRGDVNSIRVGARSNVQDDEVLIGINSVVLNGAHIGTQSIIAAGAVIPERTVIPPRSLVAGVPGKVRRAITDEDIALIRTYGNNYLDYLKVYLSSNTTP
jgi:carbonic anhydrase/acetyltransferase-like protein (isoleucine patch superfamily)